jgi:hypothetical protein
MTRRRIRRRRLARRRRHLASDFLGDVVRPDHPAAVFSDEREDRGPRDDAMERRAIEAQRAGKAVLVEAEVGNRHVHVEADLKDQPRLLAEMHGDDHAGPTRVEVHEDAGSLEQRQRDVFLRRQNLCHRRRFAGAYQKKVLCTRLATPPVPLLAPFVPESVFDGFGHALLTDLEWRRPDARPFDKTARIDGANPERMVFVMYAECTFLPRELAALHALGFGLKDEWALAPYGIDDATDGFYERKEAPRDHLWLAADNVNALVWGLHDWAHFHNHGPFEERALTELQCDVSALVWLHVNRAVIGLDDRDVARVIEEMRVISKGRFLGEGKAFTAPFFTPEAIAKLAGP